MKSSETIPVTSSLQLSVSIHALSVSLQLCSPFFHSFKTCLTYKKIIPPSIFSCLIQTVIIENCSYNFHPTITSFYSRLSCLLQFVLSPTPTQSRTVIKTPTACTRENTAPKLASDNRRFRNIRQQLYLAPIKRLLILRKGSRNAKPLALKFE